MKCLGSTHDMPAAHQQSAYVPPAAVIGIAPNATAVEVLPEAVVNTMLDRHIPASAGSRPGTPHVLKTAKTE
jgi:hypothetical protein